MSRMRWTLCLIGLTCFMMMASNAAFSESTFDGSVILGRPDNSSVTASITSASPMEVYLAWGDDQKSDVLSCASDAPAIVTMSGLNPGENTYRIYFRTADSDDFEYTQEYTFQTPRASGESFRFAVQSDSHLLNKADQDLYAQSMDSIAVYQPDFLMDMGDTFLLDQKKDPLNVSDKQVESVYQQQLPFFDRVARQSPLFLVIGNHEGEYGLYQNSLAAQSLRYRTKYYPNPTANGFYSGNTEYQDYYAFTWGDALFVAIDPYRFSTASPYEKSDGWDWSLGKDQYDWFCETLSSSSAKYKFVFAHHALGNFRGGKEIALLYEWGGYDKNGKYLFDEKRPGWGKPIQQVMEDTGVTIFFQGHDHLFATENVNGVIYQTLPKPAERVADKQNNFSSYPDATVLMNSGYLQVEVTPDQVTVGYLRNYVVSSQAQSENTGLVYQYAVTPNGEKTVLIDRVDDVSTYGQNEDTLNSSSDKPSNQNKQQNKNKREKEDKQQNNSNQQKKENKSSKQAASIPLALSQIDPTPAGSFSFCVQADPHLDENTDTERYKKTLSVMQSLCPDFVIDLGDMSMAEKLAKTQVEVEARYELNRSFFSVLGDIPLYVVNGNHDGESGEQQSERAQWSREARLKLFPNPNPDITGNILTANYYSFVHQSVQVIVLDPYTYTTERVGKTGNGWASTLGQEQYEWLKTTLQNSTAPFKLVFIHNLVGGMGNTQRGGAEASYFYEWGGRSSDGTDVFSTMRPTFEKPIHDLLLQYGVKAVFHGHDHFYAYQQRDALVYQLVPQPGTPGNSVGNAKEYSYTEGRVLPSPGFIRVSISDGLLKAEYIYVSETDAYVADSWVIELE